MLLDVKYTNDADYRRFVGCGIEAPLAFLSYLNDKGIPTTLRQVIIPTRNDSEESILALRAIARSHPCVDKVELLPFRKICTVKYESMGIPFPFAGYDTPSKALMEELNTYL